MLARVATSAQIQAALATARQNDLDWSDMAALLKQAIINAIVSSSGEVALPWSSVDADGTAVTRMTLSEAQEAYARFNALASGGAVSQFAEFSERFSNG